MLKGFNSNVVISDPRRGCFMGFHEFIFFFFFFSPADLVRAISLEPSLVETPDSECCLVLQSNFALLLTIQFASLFYLFIFFFSAKILSRPYLWNRYSQRLQIECAAWSCGLILHYCLPSNSLFFSGTILSGPYLWNCYSQRLQIKCAAWSCSLILHYCLPSNSLRYFYFFFFATILSGPYLWNRYSQRLQIECAAWSCGLILHCCLPSNSLRYFIFFFNFFSATILSGVEFFIFGGSLLGRIQGDREPVSLFCSFQPYVCFQK